MPEPDPTPSFTPSFPGRSALLDERRVQALERIAAIVRWSAIAVAVALALWLLADVAMLIFAAALLAAGLRGAACWLSRRTGLGVGWCLALVVLALVLVAALGLWLAGPSLAQQFGALREQLTQQLRQLRETMQDSPWGRWTMEHLPPALGGSGSQEGGGSDVAPRIAGTVAGVLSSTLGALGTLVLLLAAALYFAASPETYVNGMLRLLPARQHRRAREILGRLGLTLQAWLGGQMVDMLAVGVVTTLGLMALGVPLAPVLGLIAGLLNFIPYIGAIAGAVPAVLVAAADGPQQILLVIALYTVIQTVEGNVLAPIIQKRAVDLPPAATILAQTAIGTLFGLGGVILATPIAAALLAVGQEVTVPVEEETPGKPAE
ncbi:AI-2E family transporter [Roseomonas sp. NAR14]|uniref:AI-2E family transporter n=1 Tax=Roseomonas acroporae TaxID=2937791 RepID=A0A9X1YCV8_9PROT|nr:AI-2E family transporter [Roseomonas acroporae]MCK8787420.1 AI-2E family transporter [Roseomonas acroporae]